MNIVLDLVFVIIFDLGIAGVAYATIISQFISSILILILLTKTTENYRFVWKDHILLQRVCTVIHQRLWFRMYGRLEYLLQD